MAKQIDLPALTYSPDAAMAGKKCHFCPRNATGRTELRGERLPCCRQCGDAMHWAVGAMSFRLYDQKVRDKLAAASGEDPWRKLAEEYGLESPDASPKLTDEDLRRLAVEYGLEAPGPTDDPWRMLDEDFGLEPSTSKTRKPPRPKPKPKAEELRIHHPED